MKKTLVATLVLIVIMGWAIFGKRQPSEKPGVEVTERPTAVTNAEPREVHFTVSPTNRLHKLKTRYSEFTDAEKDEFRSNFVTKYKPAFLKWCNAFTNRVPISPNDLSADNFVERVGKTLAYSEYVFVVNGVTLGIQDLRGVARVDYLNDPLQTSKMTKLPDGSQAPTIVTPVSKDDVVKMLMAEGGNQFKPNAVRLMPSGVSGALNGGAIVNVGGTPDNAASWEYDMVLSDNGKLAYYLKPIN